MSTQPRVRWAVVGTSSFAVEWVAPAIQASPVASLAAVVSRSAVRARSVADALGAPVAVTGLRDLDRASVDAVHLVVPNDQHAELAIQALERGFHVMVEKPMALDVAEATRMLDAARSADRQLAIAHCMAWAPPVATAVQLIDTGRIGRPVAVQIAASFDSPPAQTWRQELSVEMGGGPLMDLGAHAVDAAIRFLGPVASVSCRLDRLIHDYPAEDTASMLLRFASGAHGSVQTTFACGQNEFVIQGTEGRLRSDEWLGREFAGRLRFEPADHGVGRFDVDDRPRAQEIQLQSVNVYRPQVDEVSRAILEGTGSRISGEQGLAVLEVLEAGVRSARTGREVLVGGVLGG